MTDALQPLSAPRRTDTLLLVLAGSLISLLIGSQVGNPSTITEVLVFGLAYLAIITYIVRRPFLGFLILCGTLFMLVVYAPSENRYVNTFDALIPFVFLAVMLGRSRQEARLEEATLAGPGHAMLRKVSRNFAIAAVVYLSLCTLSLIQVFARHGVQHGLEITYGIARCVEGALMFPLGLWLIRTDKRVDATILAIYVAGAVFAVVNTLQIFISHVFRAGMTWVINHPTWPVEAANEAGATMVILWALILADHHYKRKFRTYPMLGIVLFMLFLTQSRSGLLALATFTLLTLRRVRWPYLIGLAILVPLALKFVPADFLPRITRSVTMQKGTFEVYSILIRVYGYQSAWRVFAHNWLFGVGYLSCQFVSQYYNDLNILDLGAENFYLETAAGLGVIGLAAVAFWYVRLFQLGRAVLKLAPEGSRAQSLARMHLPLMVALSVANLTGDNFMGLTAIGQLALWTVLLVRAGHLSLPSEPARGVVAIPHPVG